MQLVFVPTDGSGKIGSPERQAIRKHCMRGKNKRADSRRSKREAAARKAEAAAAAAAADTGGLSGDPDIQKEGEADLKYWPSSYRVIARAPPSDWALNPFPAKLDRPAQQLMHQYFMRNPIRDTLYPFNQHGIDIDFDEDPHGCFHMLFTTDLCVAGVLVMTSASQDLVLHRPLSTTTRGHVRRMIPLLNAELSRPDAHWNDVLLYMIGILACVSVLFRDYAAARAHSHGMSQILRLRGDWGSGRYTHPSIQFAIDRLNFFSTLTTELWTSIYSSSIWQVPIFPAEITQIYKDQGMLRPEVLLEQDGDGSTTHHHVLTTVFRTAQCIGIVMTRHNREQTPVDGALVRQCQGYILSNLIDLGRAARGRRNNDDDDDEIMISAYSVGADDRGRNATVHPAKRLSLLAECCRAAMMAFLASTFQLPDYLKAASSDGACQDGRSWDKGEQREVETGDQEPHHDNSQKDLSEELLDAYVAAKTAGNIFTSPSSSHPTSPSSASSSSSSLPESLLSLELWLLIVLQISRQGGHRLEGQTHHTRRRRDGREREPRDRTRAPAVGNRSHSSSSSATPAAAPAAPASSAGLFPSASSAPEDVVRRAWKELVTDRGLGWEDVRSEIRRVMYMEAFHDPQGKAAYDMLCQSVSTAPGRYM